MDRSPAVERAASAAREWAARNADLAPRYSHWLLGLLDEDEGRPAALLERWGVALPAVRDCLAEVQALSVFAPAEHELFDLAQDWSLALRGEPNLTTDFVFLAALAADRVVAERLEVHGVAVNRFEEALRSVTREETELGFDGVAFQVEDPPEQLEAARIVDANGNRAREALRVLDDYARFALNDATLARAIKELRHELAQVGQRLPAALLLAARDTPGDVGTEITAGSEYERHSPGSVALVNLKRLQEALRSLEEYGKILSPEYGRAVERIRYASYNLERPLQRVGNLRERLNRARLYVLLTGSQCPAALDWTIAEAAQGGVDIVQMREKTLTDRELLDRGRRMREWTRKADVLFIVNDRPDLAKLVGADGVHLGQDDLPVAAARKILGPEPLIGVSTHDLEQVRRAVQDGADYLGVGPTFPSETKSFDRFPGLEFVQAAMAETSLPAFALGGISAANVERVLAAGATRIAVSSAIARAEEPQAAAQQLRQKLNTR
jgi:thiamine-phosphate pyrophosphorylase